MRLDDFSIIIILIIYVYTLQISQVKTVDPVIMILYTDESMNTTHDHCSCIGKRGEGGVVLMRVASGGGWAEAADTAQLPQQRLQHCHRGGVGWENAALQCFSQHSQPVWSHPQEENIARSNGNVGKQPTKV